MLEFQEILQFFADHKLIEKAGEIFEQFKAILDRANEYLEISQDIVDKIEGKKDTEAQKLMDDFQIQISANNLQTV